MFHGSVIALSAIGLVGSYHDLRFRRLPNWLSLTALILGLAAGWLMHGAAWSGMSLLHALAALLAGMVLFRLGVIGGGDAKFYAGLAAWLPIRYGALMIGATSVVGIVVLAGWLIWRRMAKSGAAMPAKHDDFSRLPYGVAIATGAVATYYFVLS